MAPLVAHPSKSLEGREGKGGHLDEGLQSRQQQLVPCRLRDAVDLVAPTPATALHSASDWLSPAIYFVTAALPAAVASNLEFASSSSGIQAVFLYDLDFFGRQQTRFRLHVFASSD